MCGSFYTAYAAALVGVPVAVLVRWTRAKVEQLTTAPARPRTMREQSLRKHGTLEPCQPRREKVRTTVAFERLVFLASV